MKRLLFLFLLSIGLQAMAQPDRLILHQEAGTVTFAVDKVELPNGLVGWEETGTQLARHLHHAPDGFSDWSPQILFNSFSTQKGMYDIGEDVVFQMLKLAWCQHRPVSLSPDVIWLLICQQFSHYVNKNPETMRKQLVSHEGKEELVVKTNDLFSEQADWVGLIDGFAAEIGKYTRDDLSSTLVADFTTTGIDERIASEVTLMDVTKPYFEYLAIYAVCGIPSITLTGTPEDWKKVLAKTRALGHIGLEWWTAELEPVLQEFVKASEGNPDYWFWKDIVKKSRPRTIQGPTCGRRYRPLTKFDGWFLKFFPFDEKGRTPKRVTITHTMLPETVAVPFVYQVVNPEGRVLNQTPLELVAGIVGVQQDPETLLMTPKIGWFVRTAKEQEAGE